MCLPLDTAEFEAASGDGATADGDGALTGSPPEAAAPDTFLYDPRRPVPSIGGVNLNLGGFNGPADQRPVESRGDVLVFSTRCSLIRSR